MARRNKKLRQIPGAILPTPERLKMAVGYDELTEANAGGMLRKTGAIRLWSALEDLYRKKLITPEQYDAGEKLYRDWYLGHVAPSKVTMKWTEYISGLGGTGNLDAAERKAFHAKRYAQANLLLDQLRVKKPVHWLVINGIKAEDVGRRLRGYRGQRAASASGTTAVALGLDLLARFYGLAK